jgi:opacity protein-like surface antigen
MLRKLVLWTLLLAVIPVAALAAESGSSAGIVTAWGPRVGFSTGPDQILLGAQLDMGNLAPDLTLTPNFDVGFGDSQTTVSLNADLHYHFHVRSSQWRPYAGAGIGFTHINYDSDVIGGGDDSFVGGSLIGGAIVPTKSGSRFFIEGKIGLGDIADFKMMIGWNFPM